MNQPHLPGFDEACDRAELAHARRVLAALGVAEHVLDFFETGDAEYLRQPNPNPNTPQPCA
jgi:hypothetical protein